MTTREPGDELGTGTTVEELARLSEALVDRITQNLLAGMPGEPVPAAIPSTPAMPHVPTPAPKMTSIPLAPASGMAPALPSAPIAVLPSLGELAFGAHPLNAGLPPLLGARAISETKPSPEAAGYYFFTPAAARAPSSTGPASASPTGASPTAPSFTTRRAFDVADIRRDFPILAERVHEKPLVWLDNAATTHKPRAVIERIAHYYAHEYSNVHRAAHTLAARSTDAYEGAREKVRRFLNASSASEIVFVRGTTEGVNLVANTWGRANVGKGDEIVLTTLEHHSNIVPWQFLADAVGARLRVVPVTDRGEVMLGDFGKLLNAHTRLVAMTHVSNALGTVLPVAEMIAAAHRHGARVLVDGAQAVLHFPVDVQALDADFYVFSGHKVFGPSGVGVVYGKKALLDEMPPWQGGGNMIERVTFEHSTFADAPARFEAGTATLAPAVGLGAALDYLERIGMHNVARHEQELLTYATECLRRIPGVRLIGTAPDRSGVVSFLVDGWDAPDVGKALDQDGIAVRSGHHCAQPTMDRFGVTSTVRPSLALYNTHAEIDQLARSVRNLAKK